MKKRNLFLQILLFISCLNFNGFSQNAPRSFVVLTSQDTIFGRVKILYNTKKKEAAIQVSNRTMQKTIPVKDVSAFRRYQTDFVMKHDLHSEYSIPYHNVLVNGKVRFFGQPCPGCSAWLSLHVEFEDGEVVCINKDNYYDIILPRMLTTPEFKHSALDINVKYPADIFDGSVVSRLSQVFELYNKSLNQAEENTGTTD